MDIEGIKRIIAGDETRTLELKKTTGELKDGIKLLPIKLVRRLPMH